VPRTVPPDLSFDEPRGVLGAALAALAQRPIDSLAGALAGACTIMILVNALALQQGRPAAATDRQAEPPARPAAQRVDAPKRSELVAQVQTALAERGLYEGVVDGLMGAGTASAVRAFEQSQGAPATGEASEKILAALLTAPMLKAEAKFETKPTAPAAPTQAITTGSAAPNPRLMAAQRALAKIGYGPVSIDGKLGAETRSAIRTFERDRGMPETGEPSPAVLRALQAMTGAPLQ
jgi:peptidoglycan hydrolase-like protein with peptidoglycan-binding domain